MVVSQFVGLSGSGMSTVLVHTTTHNHVLVTHNHKTNHTQPDTTTY